MRTRLLLCLIGNLKASQSRYQELSVQVASVLSDLQQPETVVNAIHRGEELTLYNESFPHLIPAIERGKKLAGKQYSQESENLLSQRNYSEALQMARQAAQISGDTTYNAQIEGLEWVVEAREKARANDYLSAVSAMEQAKKSLPDNPSVIRYHNELYEQASGQLYNRALKASKSGRYVEAIDYLTDLQTLNPDFPGTDLMLQQNRMWYANENRMRAESLERERQNEAAGRILLHYRIARHYDPESFELEEAVMQAQKRLDNEIELRVSIDFANQSREPGANTYIRDRVLDGLRDSDIRNLTLLEREAIDEILRE